MVLLVHIAYTIINMYSRTPAKFKETSLCYYSVFHFICSFISAVHFAPC